MFSSLFTVNMGDGVVISDVNVEVVDSEELSMCRSETQPSSCNTSAPCTVLANRQSA